MIAVVHSTGTICRWVEAEHILLLESAWHHCRIVVWGMEK